jgi:vacuolar protein sorting-associated protein 13A/C
VSLIVGGLGEDLSNFHSALIEQSVEISEPEDSPSERDLYFELLELQPIRLSLSFERTDRLSGEK